MLDREQPSIDIVIQSCDLTRGNVEEGFGFCLIFFVVDGIDVSAAKDDILDGIFDYAGLGWLPKTVYINKVIIGATIQRTSQCLGFCSNAIGLCILNHLLPMQDERRST